MNRKIIILLSVIIVIIAITTGVLIYKLRENEKSEAIITKIAEEKIVDECTDEYEQMQEEILETNVEEKEKISPNCFITTKKIYIKCGHETSQHLEISEELVNKTKEQLQEKYNGWEIEKFSDTEIILSKYEEGVCGEHYIIRDNNGQVTIYEVLEDGKEQEYEVTNISTEYLTDTDKINMKNGIEVNGKQNLNQLIEDFE